MQAFEQNKNAISIFFGNPYAINNNGKAENIIACYEDDEIIQSKAADLMQGKFKAEGTLPVTIGK